MTRWGLVLLAFLVTADQDAKEFPKKAPLARVKLKKPLLMNYELPEETKAAEGPEARQATIGRTQVVFVDVDGNGAFGDIGIDGWTTAGQRYLVPIEQTLIIGTEVVRLQFGDDVVNYRADTLKAKRDYLDVMVKLNELRLRNGLPPAAIDSKLSDGCEKHCAYMEKHGIGHEEDRTKAGYTPEGDAAGRASCINPGPSSVAVMVFYDTFYHRLPLMDPDTLAFGIGATAKFTAIDGMRGRRDRRWRHPVVIPAPETEGHATGFNSSGEHPQPYANGMKPGWPLTMTFRHEKAADVTAEVREGGPKGRLLDLLVSSPEKPAHPDIPDNSSAICVMTRLPMRPKYLHHVKVVYTLKGEPVTAAWEFTTGP